MEKKTKCIPFPPKIITIPKISVRTFCFSFPGLFLGEFFPFLEEVGGKKKVYELQQLLYPQLLYHYLKELSQTTFFPSFVR